MRTKIDHKVLFEPLLEPENYAFTNFLFVKTVLVYRKCLKGSPYLYSGWKLIRTYQRPPEICNPLVWNNLNPKWAMFVLPIKYRHLGILKKNSSLRFSDYEESSIDDSSTYSQNEVLYTAGDKLSEKAKTQSVLLDIIELTLRSDYQRYDV